MQRCQQTAKEGEHQKTRNVAVAVVFHLASRGQIFVGFLGVSLESLASKRGHHIIIESSSINASYTVHNTHVNIRYKVYNITHTHTHTYIYIYIVHIKETYE